MESSFLLLTIFIGINSLVLGVFSIYNAIKSKESFISRFILGFAGTILMLLFSYCTYAIVEYLFA